MEYIVCLKDPKLNKWYLGITGNTISDYTYCRKTYQRQFGIYKFKNFVVGYSGSPLFFQEFVDSFDMDTLPNPLTIRALYDTFYTELLNFKYECGVNVSFDDNHILQDLECDFIFLQGDCAFDVASSGIYEINDLNCESPFSQSFSLYRALADDLPAKDVLKTIFKQETLINSRARYPLLYIESGSDTIHILEKDGTETTQKLKELWSWDLPHDKEYDTL